MPVEPRVFFLNWNQPPTKSQVRKMLNTIASRGPQARGKFAASGGLRLRRFIIGPWNLVRKQLQASSGRLANLAMRFAISNQGMKDWQYTLTKPIRPRTWRANCSAPARSSLGVEQTTKHPCLLTGRHKPDKLTGNWPKIQAPLRQKSFAEISEAMHRHSDWRARDFCAQCGITLNKEVFVPGVKNSALALPRRTWYKSEEKANTK